jgi:Icc-related predicted phosphoesterase
MKNKSIISILVFGDLHGQIPKILVDDIKKIDFIICPGDICADYLREYFIKLHKLQKEQNNDKLTLDLVCTKPRQKYLTKKGKKEGEKVLNFLNSFDKPVFIVPGNWDPTVCDGYNLFYKDNGEKYDEWWKNTIYKYKNIYDIQNKKKIHKRINIIGHGSTSSPEPVNHVEEIHFKNKDEFVEYNLRTVYFRETYFKFEKIFEKIKRQKNKFTLFLSHNVPYESGLDIIKNKKSRANNENYGSVIGRILINKYSPNLCVGGHIHEGKGITKIGKTICVNSGYGKDINTLIKINLKTNKINIKFLDDNK